MKYKKIIFISVVIILVSAIFYVFFNSLFLNVEKIYNFNNISEFEDKSGLKYYDLYDLDAFIDGKMTLLSEIKPFNIHYEEYSKDEYTYSYDNSSTRYTISYNNKYPYTENDYITEDDTHFHYYFDENSNEHQIIVKLKDVKYMILFRNNKLSKNEVINLISNYILENNKYHRNL